MPHRHPRTNSPKPKSLYFLPLFKLLVPALTHSSQKPKGPRQRLPLSPHLHQPSQLEGCVLVVHAQVLVKCTPSPSQRPRLGLHHLLSELLVSVIPVHSYIKPAFPLKLERASGETKPNFTCLPAQVPPPGSPRTQLQPRPGSSVPVPPCTCLSLHLCLTGSSSRFRNRAVDCPLIFV